MAGKRTSRQPNQSEFKNPNPNRSQYQIQTNPKKFYLGSSDIHGTGVFSGKYLAPHEPVEIGIKIHFGLFPQVTPYFGSYINHSWTPNTYLEFDGTDHIIKAKYGLQPHTELTLDYRKTPWYIMGPSQDWQ